MQTIMLSRPPEVDPETWQEYIEMRDQKPAPATENTPRLTDAQYWALLAVYEYAAETLITGSDGPGYHVTIVILHGSVVLPII
jgi:hypothetical protein